VHSVLCSSLENIAPETLLRTCYNKPVKVSLTLVHYRKKIVHRYGFEANITPGFTLYYIKFSQAC